MTDVHTKIYKGACRRKSHGRRRVDYMKNNRYMPYLISILVIVMTIGGYKFMVDDTRAIAKENRDDIKSAGMERVENKQSIALLKKDIEYIKVTVDKMDEKIETGQRTILEEIRKLDN